MNNEYVGRIAEFGWTFEPTNYLDEMPIDEHGECSEITCKAGSITARVQIDKPGASEHARDALHEWILNKFRARQLISGGNYKIEPPTRRVIHHDGRVDYTLFVDSIGHLQFIGSQVDLIVRDANGNVISDTRADRQAHVRKLGAGLDRHADDALVKQILASIKGSHDDPDDALVHLFEVCDALSKRFGGEARALKELRFQKRRWNELARLANDEPIKEGRHRGKHSPLKPASSDQLRVAREVARELLEAYLAYIDP